MPTLKKLEYSNVYYHPTVKAINDNARETEYKAKQESWTILDLLKYATHNID